MLITHIELEEFKSYRGSVLDLAPGTNAILGLNGAGKTSLLEAIGLALFDYRPSGQKLGDYVREGATAARVIVTFVSASDERLYEVERRFSATTTTVYRLYDVALSGDEEHRVCLAEGGKAVCDWMRNDLQLDPTTDLGDLFGNTVGVPQGTITLPFTLTPARRKDIFDPLLRVDEYRQAVIDLLPTLRALQERHNRHDRELAAMDARLERLPTLAQERDDLQTASAQTKAAAEQAQAAAEQIVAELTELEAQAEQVRQATTALDTCRVQHRAVARALADAQERVAESQQAQAQAEVARPGYERHQEATARRGALESRRRQRDSLARTETKTRNEVVRAQTAKQQLENQLLALDGLEDEVLRLAPLAQRQRDLERALLAAKEQAATLAQLEERQRQATSDLESERRQIERVQAGLAQREAAETQIALLQALLGELAEAERLRTQEQAALESQLAAQHRQVEALSQTTGAACPTCQAELTPERRLELLDTGRHQSEDLGRRVQSLQADGLAAQTQRQATEKKLRAQQKAVQQLPSAAELERAQAREQRLADELGQLAERVAPLADAPTRIAATSAQLAELANPAQRLSNLHAQLAQRPSLAIQLAAVEGQEDQAQQSLAAATEALEPFTTLDDDLAAADALVRAHARDQQSYLRAAQLAEQLAVRQEQAQRVEEELAALSLALEADAHALDAARALYAPERHRQVRDRRDALAGQLAEWRTRLALQEERLAAVRQEVVALATLQGERALCQAKLERIAQLVRLVEAVRSLLREAGPLVTRELVRQISAQASGFYCEIMEDHTGEIEWSEDYGITLRIKGRERSFTQLSGGEQMSAALAVRLALTRQVSAMDIAFFDEPTAHLDPERRESLVEQITRIKGFGQLFVISHDDTFERAAQHCIRVVKDQDGSHAEVI
jgi:exonuclease SbcC